MVAFTEQAEAAIAKTMLGDAALPLISIFLK
jgi:hypothetical protein